MIITPGNIVASPLTTPRGTRFLRLRPKSLHEITTYVKNGEGGVEDKFGLVLSMWAMNRQRSGCGWFILGFIPVVNIIAGLVALSAENERRKAGEQEE